MWILSKSIWHRICKQLINSKDSKEYVISEGDHPWVLAMVKTWGMTWQNLGTTVTAKNVKHHQFWYFSFADENWIKPSHFCFFFHLPSTIFRCGSQCGCHVVTIWNHPIKEWEKTPVLHGKSHIIIPQITLGIGYSYSYIIVIYAENPQKLGPAPSTTHPGLSGLLRRYLAWGGDARFAGPSEHPGCNRRFALSAIANWGVSAFNIWGWVKTYSITMIYHVLGE